MESNYAEFCQEVDPSKVLALAEEMAAQNVDFRFFQNYFFNPASRLLQGKAPHEMKAFFQSPLYNQLRELGERLGRAQGYSIPSQKRRR